MQKLSSPLTFFFKYVFAGVWLVPLILGVWQAVASSKIILAVFLLLGALIVLFVWYLVAGSLKKVFISEGTLVVVGLFRKIEIPIVNVVDVHASEFPAGMCWIELASPCEFGKTVKFMPFQKSLFPGGREKQMNEIRDLINGAKRTSA